MYKGDLAMGYVKHDYTVDAKGLACPMPIIKTKKAIKEVEFGKIIEVQATDKGSTADLKAWAEKSGHHYLGTIEDEQVLKHYLRTSSGAEKEDHTYPHVIQNDELKEAIANKKETFILDVREQAEYAFLHIPESKSIPLGELEERLSELDKDKTIYVVCRTGSRSDLAAQTLSRSGFKHVWNVVPGMSEWS